MAMQPQLPIGRLSLREEGENWVAYYSLPWTMDGAIFLGSIRMGAVVKNPKYKDAFMMLMRELVADILEQTTGQRPDWGDPEMEPEHEGSGSA
jgi:hypothetical protein